MYCILLLQSRDHRQRSTHRELLRNGAKDLIAKAIEAELETLLRLLLSSARTEERPLSATDIFPDGLSDRIGDVEVRVPKVATEAVAA
ncbi:hypothetical protein MASR2M79_21930 [Aminivibrio sp.]